MAGAFVRRPLELDFRFGDRSGSGFRFSRNTSLRWPDGQPALLVIDFHAGGTLTQDVQGEAAFDPSAVPLPPTDKNYNNNVISSPQHGVWQKTGWNTFAATLLDIQYHVSTNPVPSSPVQQFGMLQYSCRLTGSGDTMEITGQETHYGPNGNQTDNSPFKANGVRIPLTILPNTIQQLPIPQPPTDGSVRGQAQSGERDRPDSRGGSDTDVFRCHHVTAADWTASQLVGHVIPW